jgi:hypothetical protein
VAAVPNVTPHELKKNWCVWENFVDVEGWVKMSVMAWRDWSIRYKTVVLLYRIELFLRVLCSMCFRFCGVVCNIDFSLVTVRLTEVLRKLIDDPTRLHFVCLKSHMNWTCKWTQAAAVRSQRLTAWVCHGLPHAQVRANTNIYTHTFAQKHRQART